MAKTVGYMYIAKAPKYSKILIGRWLSQDNFKRRSVSQHRINYYWIKDG